MLRKKEEDEKSRTQKIEHQKGQMNSNEENKGKKVKEKQCNI